MHSPRSWRPTKLGMQVQLNPDAFRRLTLKRGSRVLWEKAARCPCTVMGALGAGDAPMATGEPRSDCPEGCLGLGYLYHHPQEIRAVVLSASKNPVFYQIYGEHAKGMAMVTLLPEHMAKSWDRLTVLDSVHPVTEIRERTGATERLRYPIAEAMLDVGADGNENVKLQKPSSGIYLRRADSSGHLVTTSPEQDVDFTINEEGLLVWSGSAATFATGVFVAEAVPGTVVPAFTRFRFELGETRMDFLTTETATADGSGHVTFTVRAETAGQAGNFPYSNFKILGVDVVPGLGVEAESELGTSGGEDGNVPAIGERFSIDYWAHPTYIVNDTPHPHRDNWISAKQSGSVQWARYPIQVHCWLETFGPPHGHGAA